MAKTPRTTRSSFATSRAVEFVAPQPWKQLESRLIEPSPRRAAIAYVGRAAAKLLPLEEGDQIVIDGSDRALMNGVTHPDAVASWLRVGAEVYSLQGLHAKVILLESSPALAIVGSGNASTRSRDDLHEASIVTSDPDVCDQVSEQLDRWVADPEAELLDERWLRRARKIYRPPSSQPRRKRAPSRRRRNISGARVWLSEWEPYNGPFSPAANRAEQSFAQDHDLEIFLYNDAPPCRRGDIVVLVAGKHERLPDGRSSVSPPAEVVRMTRAAGPHKQVAVLAYRRDQPVKRLAAIQADARIWNQPLSGPDAAAVIAPWE